MVKLKHSERRRIEDELGMKGGYVLDFANRTFKEFFEDELGVDIYGDAYSASGDSKANRLRKFLEKASGRQAAKALRALWAHKVKDEQGAIEARIRLSAAGYEEDIEGLDLMMLSGQSFADGFEELVLTIEGRDDGGAIAAAISIARTYDFDTVLDEIERASAFVEDDPEDAITAASSLIESVCRSILVELNQPFPKDLSISPLYKAVREPLGLTPGKDGVPERIADDVRSILGGLAALVGGIGSLRTRGGDAHGRERGTKRVDPRIARLTVNSSAALAVFLIETWDRMYPKRTLPNAATKRT